MKHTLESLLELAKTRKGLEEIKAIVGKFCGVEPELVDWSAWKDDDLGGSCCMSARTEAEVQHWLDSLPYGSRYRAYKPRAFYRWPNYTGSLDAMAEAEKLLDVDITSGDSPRYTYGRLLYDERLVLPPQMPARATALQRAIAFILTKQG